MHYPKAKILCAIEINRVLPVAILDGGKAMALELERGKAYRQERGILTATAERKPGGGKQLIDYSVQAGIYCGVAFFQSQKTQNAAKK